MYMCEGVFNFIFAVKGVNFYGPKSEYIVSGSDCGNVFLWDKKTAGIVQCLTGDYEGVVSQVTCMHTILQLVLHIRFTK